MSETIENLRVVIADDERPARSFLAAMLRDCEGVEILGEAENGAQAIQLIEREKPDLALLDLQMPEVDGLGVVRLLKKTRMPLVAFVTAYDEYAVRAFELNAVDYLLKPVDRVRLLATLQRARERLELTDWRTRESERAQAAAIEYDSVSSATAQRLTRIPIRQNEEILLLPVREIASIVAEGELLHITTTNNQTHLLAYRLKDLEARLDPEAFVRLSRSALVNLETLHRVSPLPGGTYVATLTNGQQLNVSRLQSRILREQLLKL
ncbi:MAG: LytTR family DNA-binding domain-containing protein [Acidobacteriota bacterium]|nr:LytTR family DNA-binding domain-containing protein [Acidobacteriota bacterium]